MSHMRCGVWMRRALSRDGEGQSLPTVRPAPPHARVSAGQHEANCAVAPRRRLLLQRALAASMAWMPTRGWLQELWPALVISPDLFSDERTARRWMTGPSERTCWQREAAVALGENVAVSVPLCVVAIARSRQVSLTTCSRSNRIAADAARAMSEHVAVAVL